MNMNKEEMVSWLEIINTNFKEKNVDDLDILVILSFATVSHCSFMGMHPGLVKGLTEAMYEIFKKGYENVVLGKKES